MEKKEAVYYWENLRKTFSEYAEKEENIWAKQHYQFSVEAIDAALDALKMPETGEPLTLEQLRQMDGKPVWVDFTGSTIEREPGWFILKDVQGEEAYLVGEVSVYKAYEYYGKTWIAYAYPPDHIDWDAWEPCELCKRIDEVDPCYKDGCFRENASACDFRCDKFLEWRADRKRLTGAAFCPKCGRPITEEAQAELEKRLRG